MIGCLNKQVSCYCSVFRPSSGPLLNALRDGVLALDAQFTDFG